MPELAIIIPSRGRPGNIRNVLAAWDFTNAWDVADMVLAVDADDPELPRYDAIEREVNATAEDGRQPLKLLVMDEWQPMVLKLDRVADLLAQTKQYWALGFAGDDHLPRTINWAQRYLTVLHELGTGMVYGDDGYQGAKLSTEWAVTADAVRALGRMVPAPVEHMYCDNSMMDLFGAAGALRHLPEVRIEHMHPIAGKALTDAQYQRVNHRDQFTKDRRGYESWRHGDVFRTDVAEIRHLRKGRPDVVDSNPTGRTSRVVGSGPQPLTMRRRPPEVQRSAPTSTRGARVPRWFKNVRGATPEDVMLALASLAAQVPADQEIVELGVFQGRTALQMAWGASQGHGAHVTAIDAWDLEGNTYGPPFTDPDSRIIAQSNVTGLGYADKITLIQNFASDEAARWAVAAEEEGRDGRKVGLLFVDDDHEYLGARLAIEDWAPHLAPGAVIAVDDYGHPDWPGVKMAVDDLVNEGVLTPVEIYHDRLAVTALAGKDGDEIPGPRPVTAITSEGVSPSPYPAVEGQVAVAPDEADILFGDTEVDTSVSEDTRAFVTEEDELSGVPGKTPILSLTLPQLKQLAKVRGIVLGARKDLRSSVIQALKDGK